MPEPKVYLYWDNSNIFHSAQRYAERSEGVGARLSVRIEFERLYRLALGSRQMAKGVAVGSVPPSQAEVWRRFTDATGLTPELYQRGAQDGREQGVDQCLQIHMLRDSSDIAEPQIAVLLTGDGAGYDEGRGFHADLERMYKNGWGIEVISWDLACKRELKQWAQRVGTYIPLETYYESVTFIQDGRNTSLLNLTNRPKSDIGGSPEYQREQIRIQNEATAARQQEILMRKNAELEQALAQAKLGKEKSDAKAKYLKRCSSAVNKKNRR